MAELIGGLILAELGIDAGLVVFSVGSVGITAGGIATAGVAGALVDGSKSATQLLTTTEQKP